MPTAAPSVAAAPAAVAGHERQPPAVTVDAADAAWRGEYVVSGRMTGSRGGVTVNIPLPPRIDMSYLASPEPSILLFGADDSTGFGLQLDVLDADAATMSRIDVILPREDGGTLTVGLPLHQPLPWLQPSAPSEAATSTHDGRYRVEATRHNPRTWTFSAKPREGGPAPHAQLEDFEVELSADSPRPPWHTIAMRVTAHGDGGTVSGNLVLKRAR
jgi:hypothetical protein